MKLKIILSLFVVCTLFACSSDDDNGNSGGASSANAPTIKLNGDSDITLTLNTQYDELGATATSFSGEDISSRINISGFVDVNKTGNYEILYNVSDLSGTKAPTAKRSILVKNDADYLDGMYMATHKCGSSSTPTDDFNTTITASTTTNNQIIFSKLNPVKGDVKANVVGVNFVIPEAFDSSNVRYSGSGIISNIDIDITFNANLSGYNSCKINLER